MYTRRPHHPVVGFTLIEILVVIGMIAVLASTVLIAINPPRQFALARNTQRASGVNAILNAIGQRLAEQKGVFHDDGACSIELPSTPTQIAKTNLDLRPCLVPTYISELPIDPTDGVLACTTPDCSTVSDTYDTGFTIVQDSATKRITVCSPGSSEDTLPGTHAYCLTR